MNQDIKNKIQKAAFQMFRDWTKNAKIKYTTLDFTIIDEGILVKDLTNSIKSAVNSLKKEEKEVKRNRHGYDIGFMLGFINSNLNGHWVHEYIRKRNDDYKALMVLKALQLYLDIEDIALIKIDEIYKKIFINDVNYEDIYLKPDKKQFKDFGSNIEFDVETNRQNNVAIALENLIMEKIIKIVKDKDESFLPKVEKYFSNEDLELFISVF